jgi:uncharacterized protein (TIRG00374 family)
MSDPGEPTATRTPPPDPVSVLVRRIVVAVVVGALLYAGLLLYGDVRQLRATAERFSAGAFALALALAAGNYVLRIGRWHYYLARIGVRIPLGESALVFLAGFVMSVTPGKIGEVFKSLLLYESRGTPIARTAPIVVAERLTDLVALVLLTALGALTFEHGISVTVAGAVLVAFLLVVCAYRPLGNVLLDVAAKLPLVGRFERKLREAYDALLEMTRPGPLLTGTAIAFVAWGMECGSLWVLLHGFEGITFDWHAATFAYSASTLAGAVAMMPGGLGVTEVGMTWLLQTLGGPSMSPPIATTTTILVRIATLWFAVAIGLVALAVHRGLAGARKR